MTRNEVRKRKANVTRPDSKGWWYQASKLKIGLSHQVASTQVVAGWIVMEGTYR